MHCTEQEILGHLYLVEMLRFLYTVSFVFSSEVIECSKQHNWMSGRKLLLTWPSFLIKMQRCLWDCTDALCSGRHLSTYSCTPALTLRIQYRGNILHHCVLNLRAQHPWLNWNGRFICRDLWGIRVSFFSEPKASEALHFCFTYTYLCCILWHLLIWSHLEIQRKNGNRLQISSWKELNKPVLQTNCNFVIFHTSISKTFYYMWTEL